MKELFLKYTLEANDLINAIDYNDLQKLTGLLLDAFENSKLIFIAGNGGSAATASHFHEDVAFGALKRVNTTKRFKAVCLCDSTPYITALGNDVSFENIFVDQMKNLAEPGSLFIGITCSGNSPNILKCLDYAAAHDMKTFCLLGFAGGKAIKQSKYNLLIKNNDFGLVEAVHSLALHYVPFELNKLLKEKYGEKV